MKTEPRKPELLRAAHAPDATRPPGTARHQLNATIHATIQREFQLLSKRQPQLLQLALNEAAALAWWTRFPELFFPTLAQEKAEAVARWDARQRALRRAEPHDALALAA